MITEYYSFASNNSINSKKLYTHLAAIVTIHMRIARLIAGVFSHGSHYQPAMVMLFAVLLQFETRENGLRMILCLNLNEIERTEINGIIKYSNL